MIEQEIKVLKPVDFNEDGAAKSGVTDMVRNALFGVLGAAVVVMALTVIAGTGDASAVALKPMVCGSSLTDAWALCS